MATLRYDRLPPRLQSGMVNYIENGIPPGGFMLAVLSNDLREACARADDVNRHLLWEIVSWLWNEAPSPCWGSASRVAAWLEERQKAFAQAEEEG